MEFGGKTRKSNDSKSARALAYACRPRPNTGPRLSLRGYVTGSLSSKRGLGRGASPPEGLSRIRIDLFALFSAIAFL